MHWDKEGAHTGDVARGMVVDAGCSHVIIGHSEQRHDHGETDEQVNRKVKAALAMGEPAPRAWARFSAEHHLAGRAKSSRSNLKAD